MVEWPRPRKFSLNQKSDREPRVAVGESVARVMESVPWLWLQ
jgi:hypothetical protein